MNVIYLWNILEYAILKMHTCSEDFIFIYCLFYLYYGTIETLETRIDFLDKLDRL